MGHSIRIELTRVSLLVYLANHYTTRGALVLACACSQSPFSWLHVWCETPSRSSLQNRGRSFRPSSHHCGWCSADVFTLSLLVYNSPNGLSVVVFFFFNGQSELVTDLLLVHFYFWLGRPLLWWPRFWEPTSLFPIRTCPFHRVPSLSLFLCLLLSSFSYMFLSSPLSGSWLLKQSARVPNYFM